MLSLIGLMTTEVHLASYQKFTVTVLDCNSEADVSDMSYCPYVIGSVVLPCVPSCFSILLILTTTLSRLDFIKVSVYPWTPADF